MIASRVLVAGAVGVWAAAVGCGGGKAKSALALLPAETSVVAGLDVAKLRGTALWDEGERLVKAFRKDDSTKGAIEEMAEPIAAFRKAVRVDPFADVTSVVVAASASEPFGWAMIVTAPEPSEKGLVKMVFGEEDVEKDEIGGVTVYMPAKIVPGMGSLALYVPDGKSFVVGEAEFVEAMAELRAGKGKSAAERKELAAAVGRLDGSAVAWVAAIPTDETEEELERGPVKGLDDAIDATATLTASKGLELVARIAFAKKEDAKDVVDKLDDLLREARREAREAREEMPWVRDAFEALALEAKGPEAVVTLRLSEELLGDAAKWARKEGLGAVDLLSSLAAGGKVEVKAVTKVGGECGILADCYRAAKEAGVSELSYLSAEVDRAVAADDSWVCESTRKGIVAVLESKYVPVPPACPGAGSSFPEPPRPEPPRPIVTGSGDCKRYVECMHGLARAYRASTFAGAADAAKAMEDAAAMMEKTYGDSGGTMGSAMDESCRMGLDAMRSASDSFKTMPGFVFPGECL